MKIAQRQGGDQRREPDEGQGGGVAVVLAPAIMVMASGIIDESIDHR
jgi:hypothetical protein